MPKKKTYIVNVNMCTVYVQATSPENAVHVALTDFGYDIQTIEHDGDHRWHSDGFYVVCNPVTPEIDFDGFYVVCNPVTPEINFLMKMRVYVWRKEDK